MKDNWDTLKNDILMLVDTHYGALLRASDDLRECLAEYRRMTAVKHPNQLERADDAIAAYDKLRGIK